MVKSPTTSVPLMDLSAQYDSIGTEVDQAVREVVRSCAYIHGPFAEAFEKSFAAYCGVGYALGVANGTDALGLALRAVGVGPGDEVITTPFTFTATAEAIVNCGASVRFVDVDPATRNLNPEHLRRAITARTRAILPVHIYGLPADMPSINGIAAAHGIPVIEDAAQAVGAEIDGRRAGSFGDVACFSFYPSKNLGAYGDAGALVTRRPDVAERARLLADHGRTSKYEHSVVGTNSRLDGIQAAVLSVKLRHLDAWTMRRREIAQRYTQALLDVPSLRLPSEPHGFKHVYHLYVVETERRDELASYLAQRGIATASHYPIPLHLQTAYADLDLAEGCFPVSERLAATVLSLPLYPELSDSHVDLVISAVREFYRESQG